MILADPLNTIFVTLPGASILKDHENVVVKVEKEEKLRVPLHHVGSVVLFGATFASVAALGELADRGIQVSLLTEGGRFMARIEGRSQGGSLLRRAQYLATEDEGRALAVARGFVLGKLANQRQMLLRSARDAEEGKASLLREMAEEMSGALAIARKADNRDSLRGCEGHGAALYFKGLPAMLRNTTESIDFSKRQRRPPKDPVNALLSFLYAILLNDVCSALNATGLDPAVGFLHQGRPGRPSLGLDLMEEFRAPYADRAALALLNRQQVQDSDFNRDSNGGLRLSDSARRVVLAHWQERRREVIVHPLTREKVALGVVPHVQARILARVLRGDATDYPPYLMV
ncbi:MAG: type I-C CRISPR-associated endonuclease Cas1c [Vicinamibacteria bacterium]